MARPVTMMLNAAIKGWYAVDGKKTYIVGAIAIVYLWSQVWAGTLTAQEALEGTLIALGGMGIRHGITKGS